MGDRSGIQWTDATWNPVTGCDKVSPGCAHCYAEDVADRFWSKQYPPIIVPKQGSDWEHERPRTFTDVQCHEDRLEQPLRWKRPRKVFVNSMSDLFHEDVPDAFILEVFSVMMQAKQHTFQVLTKRAERMARVVRQIGGLHWSDEPPWPFPNVWLGVSVETQHFADERIPWLLKTQAAVRFVSYEPALGPVDWRDWLKLYRNDHVVDPTGEAYHRLDWIIIGGESGKHARPFNVEWARTTVDACHAAGVSVFVKQLGAKPMDYQLGEMSSLSLKDRKGGDPAEWPSGLAVQEYPLVARLLRT